ncbi:MAG: DUF2157 domain-containing protein [Verrucomicrobia bacterium]|nr:DUF2157 domain-containing protein [Verrucomicrobiota bacterium]
MKSFEERLRTESEAWVADGLLVEEQRSRLLARHPVRSGGAQRFMSILLTIGAALFAIGISLVIKSNWESIGDWVKLGGLVVLLGGAYTLGWRLKLTPGNFPKMGDACLMAGAVFFLLGIALVSQIFHLNSRPANGVLLWWAGVAGLPWLTRAKGMQFVSLVAGLTWLTMELHASDSWLRLVGDRPGWWNAELMLFAATGFLVGLTLLNAGLGLRVGTHAYFAGLHEKVGLLLANWALYVLGFTWSVHHWSTHAMAPARVEPGLALSLLAVGAAAWAAKRNRPDLRAIGLYALPGLVPVLAFLSGWELRDSGWLWGGLACLAMFVLNLGMIRVGLATGRESWINFGMAGIALNVITRYFLLFGTMLEGGLFFIVTGLLVLGLGYYLERKRRSLVASVRKEVAP